MTTLTRDQVIPVVAELQPGEEGYINAPHDIFADRNQKLVVDKSACVHPSFESVQSRGIPVRVKLPENAGGLPELAVQFPEEADGVPMLYVTWDELVEDEDGPGVISPSYIEVTPISEWQGPDLSIAGPQGPQGPGRA